MLFTQKTMNVLKNFYTINSSLCFAPGNILRTMSPTKTVIAQAVVDMEFPSEFCIYDLARFMSTLGLFEEPSIEVREKYLTISDKTSKVDYICAAKSLIVVPPEKNLEMPKKVNCHFTLTNANMAQLIKAMSILGLPEVAVVGKDGVLMLQGVDIEGKIQDSYSLTIGEANGEYKAIFKTDNLKLIADDYEVKIAVVGNSDKTRPVAHFVSKNEEVQYWVAVNKDSQL